MTQIAQFALVVVCVAVASLWALVRKGNVKWFLLIVGAFVAWLVLPSVILQTEWGYYQERGEGMASSLGNVFDASTEYWIKRATNLATEDCGDAEGFDVNDPSLQWTAMPEQGVVRHFFFYSKYSNVIWLGVGWKSRFCLARYLVVNGKERDISPLPTQLFPYPFFPWFPHTKGVEERLIERLPPPTRPPEGARPLLPGQCVTGELVKGETARFQVQMPYFGQQIQLLFRDGDCQHKEHPLEIEWSKNGQRISGTIDEARTGGLYQIALHSSGEGERHYQVGLYWGMEPWCGITKWREGCPNLELERYRQSLKDERE